MHMRRMSTSKLVWSRGTDSPTIVPTEKYNWHLHNRRKVQSGMEISLKWFDVSENKQPNGTVSEFIGILGQLMKIKSFSCVFHCLDSTVYYFIFYNEVMAKVLK